MALPKYSSRRRPGEAHQQIRGPVRDRRPRPQETRGIGVSAALPNSSPPSGRWNSAKNDRINSAAADANRPYRRRRRHRRPPQRGKSTLLNRLIGQKISIVSRKAQTTRHRVTGVLTEGQAQFIFVDTPGFQTRHKNALNRAMNRTVTQVLSDVDLVLFRDRERPLGPATSRWSKLLPEGAKVILVVNKMDLPSRTRPACCPSSRR